MNTTVEAEVPIEEQIIQKIIPNGCINLKSYKQEKDAIIKCMQLYHSRKCEEASKELPTNEIVLDNAKNHFIGGVATDRNFDLYVSGQKDMRKQASILLAAKQSQLEAKDKEIVQLDKGWDADRNNLKYQLQEAKVEVDRLKREVNALTETLNNSLDRR